MCLIQLLYTDEAHDSCDQPVVVTTNPSSLIRTRRSLYEALLQLEQQNKVIVERALQHVDVALSPSTCLCIWTEQELLQASISNPLKLVLCLVPEYTLPVRPVNHAVPWIFVCADVHDSCQALLVDVDFMQWSQTDCLLLTCQLNLVVIGLCHRVFAWLPALAHISCSN